MSILDRYILRGLVINYLIAMVAMLALYMILDMFINMDEFTEHGLSARAVVGNILSYYGPNFLLYFKQLSGAITLFACMSTIARLRHQNELTAILASGVSLFRVAAPVIGFGIFSALLLVVDTELLIPRVAPMLSREHDEVGTSKTRELLFLQDRDNRLLCAAHFDWRNQTMGRLLVLGRNEDGSLRDVLEADRATWEPDAPGSETGRWRLQRGVLRLPTLETDYSLGPPPQEQIYKPLYYDSDLSPDTIRLRQSKGWVGFLSLAQLQQLRSRGIEDPRELTRTRHARITAPIISVVLVLLGLPFFLDRSPANVLSDAARCMVVCGLCYVTTFVAQSVQPSSASAIPFWIPIFIFATVATVLIDRIRT